MKKFWRILYYDLNECTWQLDLDLDLDMDPEWYYFRRRLDDDQNQEPRYPYQQQAENKAETYFLKRSSLLISIGTSLLCEAKDDEWS